MAYKQQKARMKGLLKYLAYSFLFRMADRHHRLMN